MLGTMKDDQGDSRIAYLRSSTRGHSTAWLQRYKTRKGSIYLRILGAIEEAIGDGELQPGDQIPPQRLVAEFLGVDLTTVTRAYAVARSRGIVEGVVGRGTFVTARALATDVGLIRLSVNIPPKARSLSLSQATRETIQKIMDRTDMSNLMTTQYGAGLLTQRIAGAVWMEPMIGWVEPERVLVGGGGHIVLTGLLTTLARPGDLLVADALTYSGLVVLARLMHLRIKVCAADAEGMIPEALAMICAEERPAAVFCVPTLHTATVATMSVARRQAIAEVCRAADTRIIEDDAYARVPRAPLPAISAFAPERSFYLTGFSKLLTNQMRHAYLVAPDVPLADQLATTFTHLAIYPSPLAGAVLTAWISDGSIEPMVSAVRDEIRERRALAARIFPQAVGSSESYHIWLDLPAATDAQILCAAAREKGVDILAPTSFAAGPDHANGLRLSLGPPTSQAALVRGLQVIKALIT
jgi:DNA-binding transcriptional MocR family regulator